MDHFSGAAPPTSALDSLAARQIFDTMRRLAETKPVIVVSHDIRIANGADSLIVLARPSLASSGGAKVLADGPPAALFGAAAQPELHKVRDAFEAY